MKSLKLMTSTLAAAAILGASGYAQAQSGDNVTGGYVGAYNVLESQGFEDRRSSRVGTFHRWHRTNSAAVENRRFDGMPRDNRSGVPAESGDNSPSSADRPVARIPQ